MDPKMDNGMESGILRGLIGIRSSRISFGAPWGGTYNLDCCVYSESSHYFVSGS